MTQKARIYKRVSGRQASSIYHRNNANAETGRLVDGLGYRMDERIIPVVAALRALGFETTGSCEGHLDHGEAAPWIDIGEQPPKQILLRLFATPKKKNITVADEPVLRTLQKKNLKKQIQLLAILDDIYSQQNVAVTFRLLIQRSGIYGAFRLAFQGANVQPVLSRKEQSLRLFYFQREMKRFGRFLETTYLSDPDK